MKKILSFPLAVVMLCTTVSVLAENTSTASTKEAIEAALNLKNNENQEWSYL